MFLDTVNWPAVGVISGVLSGTAGAIFMLLRTRFSTIFISRHEHQELVKRVEEIDERVSKAPSYEDIAKLADKLAGLSREVAVVGESVGGVRASVSRVEHMMDMLVKQQLEREAAR